VSIDSFCRRFSRTIAAIESINQLSHLSARFAIISPCTFFPAMVPSLSIPALPANPSRIILVNPTKYLGNLLIAGNLVQQFAEHCSRNNIEFRIVIDESFRELLKGALADELLIFYPRKKIADAGPAQKLQLYLKCLRQIRHFRADIAFNVEDDSVAHRLTQLSAATYRLGCSPARHKFGYHYAMPVNFASRPEGEEHRWYSFQEIFTALGMPESQPRYLKLYPAPLSAALKQKLEGLGVDFSRKIIAIHAGATKAYKKWPNEHFAAMTSALMEQNQQVVFIGAGHDHIETASVLAMIAPSTRGSFPIDLCNQMSLAELAAFFTHIVAFVGNDSGPSHLAAAMGVPGFVIFGPTDVSIWGPLSSSTEVVKGSEPCALECSRKLCLHNHRCLRSIQPQLIAQKLQTISSA
jgi:ADP-heptose:LPS heptosyltransferase